MKKTIKQTLCILIVMMIMMGCKDKGVSTSKKDDSLEYIKEKGSFTIGLDDAFPPMGFRDEKGEIVGFDIDVAKEVAEKLGVELILKSIDWDAKNMELNNKNIDAIWNGLSINEERKKEVNFSDVYLENRQVLVVKKDSPIKKKSDLTGKIVGLQLSSTSESALNADQETVSTLKEVRKFADNMAVFMDLEAERIDAAVIDEVVARYYIGKKPDQFTILEEDFGKESYGVGFRKEDQTLVEEINTILKEFKKDGTLSRISEKWFGEDVVVQ